MRIPGLGGVNIRAVASSTVREFLEDDMPTYAAALAYHTFFAIFPFLIFLLAGLSFLHLESLFGWLVERAEQALPEPALRRVVQVLGEVRERRHGGLLSFGIVTSIWIASAGMRSTMGALNEAYDLEEDRPRVERYLLSIGYTAAFAALIAAATGLMVVGPQIAAWLSGLVGLDQVVLRVWEWLRIPTAMLLIMVAVSLVYYFAPNLEQRFQIVTPGSVLAVLLWAATAWAFSFYVSRFARYSITYGSVGAVIVLLLYFYLSASILLLGAELNAEIRHQIQARRDARTGSRP